MNEKGVCAEPRSWGPEKEEVNALKGPDKIKEQAMDTEVIVITALNPLYEEPSSLCWARKSRD